jgi:hypothetical protein
MAQLLYDGGLSGALSAWVTWYFTSRYYHRRMDD